MAPGEPFIRPAGPDVEQVPHVGAPAITSTPSARRRPGIDADGPPPGRRGHGRDELHDPRSDGRRGTAPTRRGPRARRTDARRDVVVDTGHEHDRQRARRPSRTARRRPPPGTTTTPPASIPIHSPANTAHPAPGEGRAAVVQRHRPAGGRSTAARAAATSRRAATASRASPAAHPPSAVIDPGQADHRRREDVHPCRPRWANPTGPRPVGPVASWPRGTSSTRNPSRTASIVMAVSSPNPDARGRHASSASRVAARWPDSGSVASNPHGARISRAASAFTSPNPPPAWAATGRREVGPPGAEPARARGRLRRGVPDVARRPGGRRRRARRSSASSTAPPLADPRGGTSTRAPAAGARPRCRPCSRRRPPPPRRRRRSREGPSP